MTRAAALLLALGGFALAAVGLLWVLLAVFGNEWDYCTSGDCYPGELVGGTIALVGAAAAMFGIRLARSR